MKTQYLYLLVLFGFLNCPALYSQDNLPTDRPGQAFNSQIIGKGCLQFQQGIYHSSLSIGDTPGSVSSESQLRIGLWNFEIGGYLDHGLVNIESLSAGTDIPSLNSVGAEIRYSFFEKPGLGLMARFGSVASGITPGSMERQGEIRAMSSVALPANFSLNMNAGLEMREENYANNYFYVLNLVHSFEKRWSVFIENFGNVQSGYYTTNFDAGIAFLANSDLQIDLFGGFADVGRISDFWFVNAGISYRVCPGQVARPLIDVNPY